MHYVYTWCNSGIMWTTKIQDVLTLGPNDPSSSSSIMILQLTKWVSYCYILNNGPRLWIYDVDSLWPTILHEHIEHAQMHNNILFKVNSSLDGHVRNMLTINNSYTTTHSLKFPLQNKWPRLFFPELSKG